MILMQPVYSSPLIKTLVQKVEDELKQLMPTMPREDIIVQAMKNSGYIITPDLDTACCCHGSGRS